MLNEEGAIDPEEFLAEYAADRAETTAAVWLAQTFNCCRCHDHKFDPFTSRDFYSLKAFFNNVPERGEGNYGASIRVNAPPQIKVPTPEIEAKIQELQKLLAGAESANAIDQVTALKKQINDAESSIPTTLVMEERKEVRPPGINPTRRRAMLDDLAALNRSTLDDYQDPEIQNRIDQFEMAFRMQASVPELSDLSQEPASVFDQYGQESRKPGSYAANCILARRLAERGVRFIQLYHRGWDQHDNLPSGIKSQCYDVDQPTAALLTELKDRGLLEDTLVIWGGEFGRTVFSQGKLTADNYGRDHHPRCFSIWMAGAGVKRGHVFGETDEFSYNILKDPVHIHDLNATALHLLGIDHTRLTHRFQGRDYRLTDVHGNIVSGILA